MNASPAHAWMVTQYDPANFDDGYVGDRSELSGHGAIEASYLDAVRAFAAASGITTLTVREPEVHFPSWPERLPDSHVLTRVVGQDLAAFHDGAQVPLDAAVELVREMLVGDDGVWCRLEHDSGFFVHVGWDTYMYVGSAHPCPDAVRSATAAGLVPVPIDRSPYEYDESDRDDVDRPADDDFWHSVNWLLQFENHLLLEEAPVHNTSRWHRITRHNLDDVRAALAPRAMITVRPGLSDDVAATMDLPPDSSADVVWTDQAGTLHSVTVWDPDVELGLLRERLATAATAAVFPLVLDDRPAICSATLPDTDGALRARWRPHPAPADHEWARLTTYHRGDVVTGTITLVAAWGAKADIGGCTADLNIPEVSWRPINQVNELYQVGDPVTAEVLDVDQARLRLSLSVKALLPHPAAELADRIGKPFDGIITKVLPFGAFATVDEHDRPYQGLILDGNRFHPAYTVGDPVRVTIDTIDQQGRIRLRLVADEV